MIEHIAQATMAEPLTTRDAITLLSSLISVAGALLYQATWRALRNLQRRAALHSNWLTDLEGWSCGNGKPRFEPKENGDE